MLLLLQSAPDRDGPLYFSRIDPNLVWALVWLSILFCAIHAIRRAKDAQKSPRPVAGYILNQRLYHWGNFVLLSLLTLSGYFLFFRHPFFQSLFGISWLHVHEWTGLVFAVGVVIHAVAAKLRGDWESMRPRAVEWREMEAIWRNFLGLNQNYPASGKYDALQKIYHHILALVAILFTASGALMWLSASQIIFAPRSLMHLSRITHDCSAAALIVMVIGHIYFSIIKTNRKHLKDMAGWPDSGAARKTTQGGD